MPSLEEPAVVEVEELCRGKRFALAKMVLKIRGRLVARDVLLHPGAVVVLPLKDAETVVMLKQFRPGPRGWIYELPAGTLEPGESPEETARRELVEETGYEASEIEYMFKMYTSPGVSTEIIYAYLARGLKYVGARPEEYEAIRVIELPIEDALEMIRRGEVEDAKTIATLLYYAYYMRSRG